MTIYRDTGEPVREGERVIDTCGIVWFFVEATRDYRVICRAVRSGDERKFLPSALKLTFEQP